MRLYMLRHLKTGEYFKKNNKVATYATVGTARSALGNMGYLDSTDLTVEQMWAMSNWAIKRYMKANPLWEVVEFELIETRIVA